MVQYEYEYEYENENENENERFQHGKDHTLKRKEEI